MTARTGGSLDVSALIDKLITTARAQAGLHNFGRDTWREGLEQLVCSAESEGRFTTSGRETFYASLVRTLITRLQVEDWFTRHPEIDEQDILVELVGVGFPRTGSTALSHMLGEERGVRHLRMWEQSSPCPPPGVSAEADEARIEATKAVVSMSERVASRLRSMLPSSATGPTEDHDLMALEFKAEYFLSFAFIPSYAEWFVNCDMEPTYQYERRALKLLQWKCPPTRWWLKNPTHTLFLDSFEKVFPEARFVMTHRDVSNVIPSVADLFYTMLQRGNEGVDPKDIGRMNMEEWGIALDRVLAFRDTGRRNDRFFDIGFSAFQTDPIASIRNLYTWLGRELTEDTVQRMLAWRQANPRDKYGIHEYAAEDFGITDTDLAKRYGPYRERFGLLL